MINNICEWAGKFVAGAIRGDYGAFKVGEVELDLPNEADRKMWSVDITHEISPNQIKCAEPVTYDEEGNVIPLSERFSESEDIRYSVGQGGYDFFDDDTSAKELKSVEPLDSRRGSRMLLRNYFSLKTNRM